MRLCRFYLEQELQQQLIIETRNLKKMRTFYQKLIQQEKKKGLLPLCTLLWYLCLLMKKKKILCQRF